MYFIPYLVRSAHGLFVDDLSYLYVDLFSYS
jgi:hypothetical protein